SGSACFLNAAVQLLRRAHILRSLLENHEIITNLIPGPKERSLRRLYELIAKTGNDDVIDFRAFLFVFANLGADFLKCQQDSNEAVIKIFEAMLPSEVSSRFSISTFRREKCGVRDDCAGRELPELPLDVGPIVYQYVTTPNQIVDLESRLSAEWKEDMDGIVNEEEIHCAFCCECCSKSPAHIAESCNCFEEKCTKSRQQRFAVGEDAEYVIVPFSIRHVHGRYDWALRENCNLDSIRLFGKAWSAVAIIKHIGAAGENWSYGHYVAYTKEDDGQWWLHDDDKEPQSIGTSYSLRGCYSYSRGETDMEGVTAILFQKQ
ncbi:hypothetical protein PFISCL1PPCAC_16887, partial [Pristionchus fissidentatus]